MKDIYNTYSQRFALPEFDRLDYEFEISTIDEESFILRHIRRKMAEKVENFAKLIEGILNPDTTPSALNECRAFTDEEKDEMYKLYKKLMHCYRRSTELDILDHEENDAEYIKSVFGAWDEIKERMLYIVGKMKDTWKEEPDKSERLEYFG